MSEMTLPSRHRIRNSNPGDLGRARYLSVTEAPHNTEFYKWMGKKHYFFVFFSNRRDRETKPELTIIPAQNPAKTVIRLTLYIATWRHMRR